MSADVKPRPSERRKERLRSRIIEEAVKLYHQNGGEHGGFEGTTVESIADRADISLRTFFRYFESKQDVIYLDYRRAVSDMEAFILDRLDDEPPEQAALNGCIDQIIHFIDNPVNRERILRALTSTNFTDRRSIWRSNAQARIAELLQPRLADRPDPALAARMAAMIVRGVVDDGLARWALAPAGDPAAFVQESLRASQATMRIMLGGDQPGEGVVEPKRKKARVR